MAAAGVLFVYLVPPSLSLFFMIKGRTFSPHQLRSLLRRPRRVSREDWLAVYDHIGVSLESRNGPRLARPTRPWRLIGAGAMCVASVALLLLPVPLLAQSSWGGSPLVKAALAGGEMAAYMALAFHRPRAWLLFSNTPAEYPHLDWTPLRGARTREEGK